MHRNDHIVAILCVKDHNENDSRNNLVLVQPLVAPALKFVSGLFSKRFRF